MPNMAQTRGRCCPHCGHSTADIGAASERNRLLVVNEELVKAYQSSDLTILPSIDASEAFGMVLVESMACGTPVIASDLPGVRTVVSNVTGLLVQPNLVDSLASAIDTFIKQPSQLIELRKASAERAEEKYGWPRIIDKLEQIYIKLL